MSCNGWNHPPGCDCSWGGQGNPDNLIRGGGRFSTFSNNQASTISKGIYYDWGWLYEGNTTFQTNCWWCGQEVYFHRNENGGCVLFDELGSPWQVHTCWEKNREQQSKATNAILENHKKCLKRTKLNEFQFSESIPGSLTLRGFFIGFNSEWRLIATKTKYHDKNRYFRYFVFKTEKGIYLKVLASEENMQKLSKFAYSNIDFNVFYRNKQIILELEEISSLKLNLEEKKVMKNSQSIKGYLAENWTHQFFAKRT